ncbi:MAG: VOC family protein [Bryobacteraceae bacterium]|jgi:uncharacterized glyoxalase superfamily protein PhnB
MSTFAKQCRSTVIPAMRYRDAPAAIEWLCRAFGFEKQAVYPNPDGSIAHAQLVFGNGMVMLGSVNKGTPHAELIRQPEEVGGVETQAPCLIVSDCDGIYAMAKAAGAEMVMEIADMGYGGRAFSCRDPEGHLWSVGSFDPWADHA